MNDMDDWLAAMKQKRDEMKLQLHLASKEAEEEWDELVSDWDRFVHGAQASPSSRPRLRRVAGHQKPQTPGRPRG